MAFQFYLDVKGKTQGSIKGSSTKSGKGQGSTKGVLCHGFQYTAASQRDAASGLPSGKRQHQPITVTKEVDSSSPLFFHAQATNESFPSATLSFIKPDSSGKEVVFKTIELTNATVSRIDYAQPHKGNRSQSITFEYEELAVDGAKNGTVPYSLLRRGPWGW